MDDMLVELNDARTANITAVRDRAVARTPGRCRIRRCERPGRTTVPSLKEL